MKFKRIASLAAALALLVSVSGVTAFAAESSAKVYVTIANGTLGVAQDEITVTDADKDGALTINDALYLEHEKSFTGGAAAGYASEKGQYGLAISKLWGVANGSGYGYYVNNKAASNLTDPVKDGDYINAFVYTDTAAFSDAYCYFDAEKTSAETGKAFTLTLTAAAYDADWKPITKPVEGAVITVDGTPTSFKTDKNGKVTVTLDAAKEYVVSAVSESGKLVPPVCRVMVTAAAASAPAAAETPAGTKADVPQTGDADTAAIAFVSAAALAGLLGLAFCGKRGYEA